MSRDDRTFELSEERSGDVSIVLVRGRITIAQVEPLDLFLRGLLDAGRRKFVLDLHEMEHIVSGGIGALIGFNERAKRAGGAIRIANTHPKVEKIFGIMSLDSFFSIYSDRNEAVRSLAE